MAKAVPLRVNRIGFYRLHEDEFFQLLFDAVLVTLGEGDLYGARWSKLSNYQQGVYGWWCFWGDVLNGGLTQFFYNHTDRFVPALETLLTESGNETMAALLQQATKIYRQNKKEFEVENPFGEDGLFARMTELSKLDRGVAQKLGRTSKELEKWLRENISLVAVGDSAEPIDPKFSGEIETHFPNGKVHEQATVRRGTVSGPYRRYFDDGTLEHASYYAGGKVSADYWPNGQPKHKTQRKGKLQVDEWYYPSGKIQKRFVSDKSGHAVEPVRLWHDNGQLAEEIHTKAGNKLGPWMKWFEDGSPRLEAEHRKGEELFVMNAWDDQRVQVVTGGDGKFFDDGVEIDVSWNLIHDSDWTREVELRKGLPHGAGTTWIEGVLWSKQEYAGGKLHGTHTLFYDNGRVRTRSTHRKGKEIKAEEFPKFDNPRPAVLLSVKANAGLYEAWKQPLLDVYPVARNLDKLQRQLPIPEFLTQVFQRNLSGDLKDDYDDLNTFSDGISYMVMVDERGEVDDVSFSGASAYSGSVIDEYPPFIQQLKFEPGRIGQRKVRCRVVVSVDHTFVESSVQE